MSNNLKTIGKTEDELRVGNYLALWGGTDLHEERFLPETEFESNYTKTGAIHVDWEHGMDPEGDGPKRDDVLGVVDWKTSKKDDTGLWAERVLNRRAEYMEYIEALIDEGLVGTSSEAVGKNVEVDEDGNILRWPLKRDSLTVMPAEPRMLSDNAVEAIKALSDRFPNLKSLLPESAEGASAAETETDEIDKQVKVKETSKMSDKEQTEVREEAVNVDELLISQKETSEQVKGLTSIVENMLERMQQEPPEKDGGFYTETGGKSDPDHKSFGDFLLAIQRNDKTRLKSVYKAMGEDSGTAGGYLVPEEFHNRLMMVAENQAIIRPRATVIPVRTDAGKIPSLDQSSTPTAGSGETALAGGVTGGWVGEGSAGSSTDAAFKQIEYNIKKIAGYTQVSNELIADSAQTVDAILSTVFGMAVGALEEMSFIRGSGAGAPLGLLNANAAISVSATSSGEFSTVDALNMLAKFRSISGSGVWIAHRDLIPEFDNLTVSGGGLDFVQPREGVPMNLLGYPIMFSEHIPQLNSTAGMPLLVDPAAYVIFDRQATAIAFSEHAGFTSDQGTWRFTKRLDGQPWLSDGITLADPDGSYKVSPIVYCDAS